MPVLLFEGSNKSGLEDIETIEGGDFTIEVDTRKSEVTISDGFDAVWFTSDKLAPLVLALLELILEKGWHGDVNL